VITRRNQAAKKRRRAWGVGAASLAAAWLFIAPAAAQELPPAPSSAVEVGDEARQRFDAGVGFLQDPDGARYEPALGEFMAAYQASPSWKILGNLGLCALKLERQSLAIDAYKRYLAEGKDEIDPEEQKQIARDIQLLESGSSPVVLTMSGGDAEVELVDKRIKADGSMAINTYRIAAGDSLDVLLAAGQHQMSARSGDLSASWEANLEPRQAAEHTFELEKAEVETDIVTPPPQGASEGGLSTLQTVGLVTAAAGGLAIVGGVITGVIGSGQLSDLEERCPNQQCSADDQGDADSIETMQTLTNVLWIGGGVLAATGVGLLVFGGDDDAEATGATPSVRILAAPSATGGGFFAHGRF